MLGDLRRTNADKRRAVEMLLRDEEWSKKSDRWIAEKCGVHHEMVGRQRPQLAETASSHEPTEPTTPREGRDGKTYPTPKPKPRDDPPPLALAPRAHGRSVAA